MGIQNKSRWLMLVLLLLLVGTCFWAFPRRGMSQRQYVDRLYVGFDDPVSLVPVLAKLDFSQAPMFGGRRHESKAMYPVFPRVLRGDATANDLAFVTGVNWSILAYIDDTHGTLLGAEVWRRAVEVVLSHPEVSLTACVDRLRYWPPALRHLNLAQTFEKKFISEVVMRLCRDAEFVVAALVDAEPSTNTFTMATALYEAGANFRDFSKADRWRRGAEKGMVQYFEKHQKPDGSMDGDFGHTFDDIETMVRALAVGYRAGIPVSGELTLRAQKLLDVMMLTLDMDGGLPFREPEQLCFNQREWMFWAGKIFNRRDYAWIGNGGLDALFGAPPARTNAYFADLGFGIMRNNWDIRWYLQRDEAYIPVVDVQWSPEKPTALMKGHEYNHFSNTLRLDQKKGMLELYAFGEQQMRVMLPWTDLEYVNWIESADGVTFIGKKGDARVYVTQPIDSDAWVVHVVGLTASENLKVRGLHVKFLEATNGVGVVTQPQYFRVNSDVSTVLQFKSLGSVCLRTDSALSGYDGTNVEVRASAGKALTLVMMGASGIWINGWTHDPGISPRLMAEARRVTFAPAGCSFEAWASVLPVTNLALIDWGYKDLKVRKYYRPGNRLLHISYSDTATNLTEVVRMSVSNIDEPVQQAK